MTIGSAIAIIAGVICVIIGIGFAINNIWNYGDIGIGIAQIIGGILAGIMFIGGALFYLETESGKRAIKDLKSEMENGISRTVAVYDVNGELIREYSGKFDIETGNAQGAPYIVFDDENDKRHIIYYTTGTILIDEK